MKLFHFLLLFILHFGLLQAQTEKRPFDYLDVFQLEWASNPQISPDGKRVIYERNGFDIMKDKKTTKLWIMNTDGSNNRKLTSEDKGESQASWSDDGKKIAFVSSTDDGSEIYVYWTDSKTIARLSQLEFSPSSLTWSPDGKKLAFSSFVASSAPKLASMPKKPKGAKWAEPARITTRLNHESDGSGYIKDGFSHLFTISAEGGTAKQITSGDFHHRGGISWGKMGRKLYFSGNRNTSWEYDFNDSNIYSVDVETGEYDQLSANKGPEYAPIVSPDGNKIAYLAYDDKIRTYQLTQLHVMDIDGGNKNVRLVDLDRSVSNVKWNKDSKAMYFMYDDKGNTKVARVSRTGGRTIMAKNVGGTTIGRPYASGSYSISNKGHLVYTQSTPHYPAELAFKKKNAKVPIMISRLNEDILTDIELGKVEEVWYKSSVDQRELQGWIIMPPGYDASKKYPLLVENHGGPILNYGDRFTAELQLYASKGYLVFYPNPRGSTSYGEEFGDLLYNNYPGDDYQDVMDGVDYLIGKGLTSEDQLFVTGGSAGGIMTAWMIGKNNRFEAAVVHKPVMNWISKTLVADNYYGYANYRYPGQPWENFEGYWKFSPVSLVGNIETPTMVMVGMNDLRTPPSEAKQLYHALKLRKIESMYIEIPGASHGIARRPSNLIMKVAHTVEWCNRYRK